MRHAAREDLIKMELTQKIVVLCHCALALQHVDQDLLSRGSLVLHHNRDVDNRVGELACGSLTVFCTT